MLLEQPIIGRIQAIKKIHTQENEFYIIELITQKESQVLPLRVGPSLQEQLDYLAPNDQIQAEAYLNTRQVETLKGNINYNISLQLRKINKL